MKINDRHTYTFVKGFLKLCRNMKIRIVILRIPTQGVSLLGTRVVEAIITAALVALVTFISSLILTYFFNYNSSIRIGTSNEIGENQFILPININTFEKDIKDLRISTPMPITEKQIKSNQPLQIKILKSNIGTKTGSVLEIDKVSSDKNIQLVLTTSKLINDKDIQVSGNGNKVTTEYLSEAKNPLQAQLKNLILNAILYAIIFGISTYLGNRRLDIKNKRLKEDIDHIEERRLQHKQDAEEALAQLHKRLEDAKVAYDEVKGDANNLQNKFKETETKIEEAKTESLKKQILLQAKLNDYRKELNFWRNTIRKVIYELPNGEKKAEEIFKSISTSLKTYQTHENNNHDFETLKVLSKMINDKDSK